MADIRCPYCSSGEDLFQAALAATPEKNESIPLRKLGRYWQTKPEGPESLRSVAVEQRGKYWLIVLEDKHFKGHWKNVKVEILGIDFKREVPLPPSPLFFGSHNHVFRGRRRIESWRVFNACQITHKNRNVTVQVHWWPGHGHIPIVRGLRFNKPRDYELVRELLTFFFDALERRGRKPKVTDELVSAAFEKEGPGAPSKDIVRRLDCSDSAYRKWRDGRTHEEVARRYGKREK